MEIVLVTGASGKLGQYIINYLLENTDYNILAQYNKNSSNLKQIQNQRVISESVDFIDSEKALRWVDKIFSQHSFEYIFSCASIYPSNSINNIEIVELNNHIMVNTYLPYYIAKSANKKKADSKIIFFLDERVGKNSKADTAYLISKNALNFLIENLKTLYLNTKFYAITPTIINDEDLLAGFEKEELFKKSLNSILSNDKVYSFII